MDTMTIPLTSIFPDTEFNVRKVYDDKLKPTGDDDRDEDAKKDSPGLTIRNLMVLIEQDGLMSPLLVRPAGKDGKYHLVAGYRRYAALLLLQERSRLTGIGDKRTDKENATLKDIGGLISKADKTNYDVVNVNVFVGKDEEAYIANLNENLARKDLTSCEVATRCHLLKKKFEWTTDKIASRTRLSKSHVDNLVHIVDDIDESILEAWGKGTKGVSIPWLLSIVTKPRDEQVVEFNNKMANGDAKKRGAKDGSNGTREDKTSRPSIAELTKARETIADMDLNDTVKESMLDVLDYAMGSTDEIPGVYDPTAEREAEKKAKEDAKVNDDKAKHAAGDPAYEAFVLSKEPGLKVRIDHWKAFNLEQAAKLRAKADAKKAAKLAEKQ